MVEVTGMRVAMLIQSYLPRLGGAEKQLAAICRKLRQQGMEPSIITRRYAGMAPFEVIDQTPVYRMPAPRPKPLAALCYLLFGLNKIRQLQPHVIHAHELLSPTDMAVAAKRRWHIPLVVKVLRGGKLGDLYKLNHRASGRARIRRMKESVDIFLSISQEIESELVREGIGAGHCRFVPNGVDMAVYHPVSDQDKADLRRQLQLPQGLLCIYSGRLAAEKGLPVLLQAWQTFSQSHPQANLLVLGSGEMEAELRENAGGQVIFRGYVPEPQTYLQACDIFVLPSETEGLSNAMLEAMACGLAVVATCVGAAQELIEDKRSGLLVQAGDASAIMEALGYLAAHPEERESFAKHAVDKVTQAYSLDNTVAQLLDIYAELAGRQV